MENTNETSGSDRTPVSNFEELLNKPIHNEDDYFHYVEALYDEWKKRVVNYPTFKSMLKCFGCLNPDLPPQFFTGDIKSKVVIISLNGHAGDQRSEIDATPHCQEWPMYKDYWENFVTKRYKDYKIDPNTKKERPVSNFDAKLHQFLDGRIVDVTSNDLSQWHLLHMELCPFLSSSYSSSVDIGYIKNYLLRTLEAIALQKREIVLVLNGQICTILDKFIPKKRHTKKNEYLNGDLQVITNIEKSFYLTKKNNEKTRFEAKRIDYTVKLKNLGEKTLNIVAVPTFAMQGMAGDLLVEYNQKAFMDEERKIITDAIH